MAIMPMVVVVVVMMVMVAVVVTPASTARLTTRPLVCHRERIDRHGQAR